MQATNQPLPDSFTPQQREEFFEEILIVYDHLDSVLACVAADNVKNRGVQMELLTPFVTQAKNAANILSAFYTEVAKKNRPITPDIQDTFESAFRTFYDALDEIITGMEEKLLPQRSAS